MITRLLSRLGGALQFVTVSVLLTVSFLIQYHGIATYAGLPWLAYSIAALLVVARVLATGYWHSPPILTVSTAVPLGLLRMALWILALFCSIHFFLAHLEGVDPKALRVVARLYHLTPTRTELLLSLSVFLALLLELALAVVLGHLARAPTRRCCVPNGIIASVVISISLKSRPNCDSRVPPIRTCANGSAPNATASSAACIG